MVWLVVTYGNGGRYGRRRENRWRELDIVQNVTDEAVLLRTWKTLSSAESSGIHTHGNAYEEGEGSWRSEKRNKNQRKLMSCH